MQFYETVLHQSVLAPQVGKTAANAVDAMTTGDLQQELAVLCSHFRASIIARHGDQDVAEALVRDIGNVGQMGRGEMEHFAGMFVQWLVSYRASEVCAQEDCEHHTEEE